MDEAQSLSTEQVKQLHRLVHVKGIPVICYGLHSEFLGEPFRGASYLMILANTIEELKNIFPCGKKGINEVFAMCVGGVLICESIALLKGAFSFSLHNYFSF